MDRSGDDRLSFEVARALLQGHGSPEQAMTAVDRARQGHHVPGLSGRSPEELGVLDRLAWGRVAAAESGRTQALLEGLLGVAPYEAAKGMAQSGIPGVSHVGRLGLRLGGQAAAPGSSQDFMEINETTSPASMKNVLAFFAGALDNPEGEEELLKKRQVAQALAGAPPGVAR